MSQGKFALCVYRYRGPTGDYLDVHPGTLLITWQTEGGWVGALDLDASAWGWLPLGYVRFIDDETVAVLEPIAQQLRIGAFQAMTAIRATATDPYEGYSSPDSNESDTLGDEWAHIPKQRRSRATSRPREMRESIEEIPPVPQSVQFAAASPPPPSFPRRTFRLRSKSRDGTRSDSEPSRSRRPSVSLRRTRVSMFGQREPNPVEQMRKLEARPCYLQPRHTNDIVIDPDGSVRAGTLEAIAERMTFDPPSASYERALRRAVLFTYEAFTSSQQLFDLITDQYSLEPPREMSEAQFKEWKEVRLRPTQARVLDVLGMWLDLPRLYQDDPELVSRIREFLQFVTEPDNLASEARVHLRTIDKLATPLGQPRPPTPQRQRRRAPKPRPFPTLSPTPSHSHSVSGTLLLSPTNSRVRSSSPGHSSPVQGYSSPILRSTSPRLGASSPSPSHGTSLSPSHGASSPLGTSTSMTSLPSSNARSDESALGRARSQRHTSSSHASSDWSYITSSKTRPAHVASLDPTALAHHLTLLESSLYMRVKRIQCLEWHKTKAEDEANDLRAFCATSDRLAAWVKWSVLSLDSAPKRADAVGVWVRVADKCRVVNNMSSLSAIVAGLTSADVSRLPHTMRHVLSVRAQRLEQLSQMTSPAGGFAALKLIYANDGSGVPFVGMYLTALVHASDQFKDYVPMPDKLASEPVTPTQTRSRLSIPYGRSSIDSSNASSIISHGSPAISHASPSALTKASPLISQGSSAISYISHSSAGERTPIEPRTPIPNQPSSPTASTSAPKLLNFTKRHKQSEIIGAMLKFQTWPYAVASNPDAPATTPTTAYPYPPVNSSLTIHASAGGVAWIEEQLERAAKLTLGTDWAYERSSKLYEDETGGRGGGVEKDFMTAAGF